MADDPLDDFTSSELTFDGETKTVFRAGTGPGIVVMSEMPGITPKVADFARRLVAQGYTVAMPHLFGTPGKSPSNLYLAESFSRACVSGEFTTLAAGKRSKATDWLRALGRQLHEECGGPGVGAIGMCFTGGFALALMLDDALVAPVLSQPSVPFPVGKKLSRDLGLSDEELTVVSERSAAGCDVLGLRFTEDSFVGDRFSRLTELFGDSFIGVEIDSSPGNPHGISKMAHSVVTEDLVDEPGHPTREALDTVLDFFSDRLLTV